MTLKKTIKNIKSLKIQGARAIGVEAIKTFKQEITKSKAKTPAQLYNQARKIQKQLVATRPTEPFLRNMLNFCFYALNKYDVSKLKSCFLANTRAALIRTQKNKEIIAKYGARKIKKGSVVYTHCHSSTVIDILKQAKKEKKKFEVHNTETRPRFQGRKTARDMVKAGIPVTHYVDSAARLAMKKADIILFGCDAITPTRIFNKIGSEMFAEIADKYGIPVYICTDSWKFDPETMYGKDVEVEKRDRKEVWPGAPKKIKIMNYAFEKINPEYITGIISDVGVLKHDIFIFELQKEFPWMFKNIKR